MFDSQLKSEPTTLMTIGYEGSNLPDFIETLKVSGVKLLLDIRELPLSRKKGFSKNALREAVEAAGIGYRHYRQLGDPKPGRDAAKSGDIETFKRIFGKHMQQPETLDTIDSLVTVVSEGGVCLLCFERHHHECHRAIVASELSRRAEVRLDHIGVKDGIAKQS